jgi:hypothetical protein
MLTKISFYGYLFMKPASKIIRYDILWRNDRKYLLKHTVLNPHYKNPSAHIAVTIYENLHDCIAAIVNNFRNKEIEMKVYKKLEFTPEAGPTYEPLIDELEYAITKKSIKSFSVFGHICKYKPQTAAKELLKSMGYFVLTTHPPHVYVLDDFIKKELLEPHQ